MSAIILTWAHDEDISDAETIKNESKTMLFDNADDAMRWVEANNSELSTYFKIFEDL